MASSQVTCPHCGAQSSATAALCYNCNGDLKAAPQPVCATVAASAVAIGGVVSYNPRVIQDYAKKLYAQADLITWVYTGLGLVVMGALLGTVGGVTSSFEAGALLGALIGGGIGYFIGNMKANALRLEAQLALCQVEIERNTQA